MPKFLEVSDKVAARRAINVNEISVLDFISDPSDTTTHSAGFQAAINAAAASGGPSLITIPSGDWFVENLSIPQKTPLRIVGAAGTIVPTAVGTISRAVNPATVLVRTGSNPIFKAYGGESQLGNFVDENGNLTGDLNLLNWPNFVRDWQLENVAMRDDNPASGVPMVDMKGCTGCHFYRVTWFSPNPGASQLVMMAVWDTKFVNCYFTGGGGNGGIPQVWIKGGNGTTYSNCTELQFLNTIHDNYAGPGLVIGEDEPSLPFVATIMSFTNHKMESKRMGDTGFDAGPHVDIRSGNNLMFKNFYVSHRKTPGPVFNIGKAFGVYGDLNFNFLAQAGVSAPTELVEIGSTCNDINLDVHPWVGYPEEANCVTINGAANNTPRVDVRVVGPSRLVNSQRITNRWLEAGTIRQSVNSTNECQYVFAKESRSFWALGNPDTTGTDTQRFHIRAIDPAGAGALDIATFQLGTYDEESLNPTTATRRQLALNGFLNLYNTTNGWVNFAAMSADPATPPAGLQLYAKNNGGGGTRNEMFILGDGAARVVEARGIATTASTGSLTINSDRVQHQSVTALAEALTINAPTGTPTAGQALTLWIRDNGTSRTLTWNAAFAAKAGGSLPTATVVNSSLVVMTQWNPTLSKWEIVNMAGNATDSATQVLTNKTLTTPRVDSIRNTADTATVMTFAAPTAGNYLAASASSGNPTLSVLGSSTDISLTLGPKGTGVIGIFVGAGQTPTVEARGADTNHDLKLVAKGSGIVRSGSDPVGVKVSAPANGTAAGKPGQWAADANYIYAYTGDGTSHTWVRSAITAW